MEISRFSNEFIEWLRHTQEDEVVFVMLSGDMHEVSALLARDELLAWAKALVEQLEGQRTQD